MFGAGIEEWRWYEAGVRPGFCCLCCYRSALLTEVGSGGGLVVRIFFVNFDTYFLG
jgi:hypothetical protein